MTKAEIAKLLSERISDISKSQAAEYIEVMLTEIKRALARGEHVLISGFGKFSVKDKSARVGRNPQTGEKITLDGRRVVTFKTGSLSKKAVKPIVRKSR